MKKLFMVIGCVLGSLTMANAQGSCMAFFPTTPGTTLVNKTYDANKNLISTTIYQVVDSDEYFEDREIEVNYTLTNGLNNMVDQGKLMARCENGDFYLNMINRSMAPEAVDLLTDNTELIGNFLDYPDPFNTSEPILSSVEMGDGEFSIRSKTDKEDLARVRVYHRNYQYIEKVDTPAGNFDAAKVTFTFDVIKDDVTKTYKGVEWYALGAGIVRSETYSEDDVLQNYTELAELREGDNN